MITFRALPLAVLLSWLVLLGCSDAKIDKMIPGGNIGTGELE